MKQIFNALLAALTAIFVNSIFELSDGDVLLFMLVSFIQFQVLDIQNFLTEKNKK